MISSVCFEEHQRLLYQFLSQFQIVCQSCQGVLLSNEQRNRNFNLFKVHDWRNSLTPICQFISLRILVIKSLETTSHQQLAQMLQILKTGALFARSHHERLQLFHIDELGIRIYQS